MPKILMDKKDWVAAKRRYIYSDATMGEIARDFGITRQGLSSGFQRQFPGTDLQKRKREESAKRNSLIAEKAEEKRQIARLRFEDKLDTVDENHLEIINLLLETALEDLRKGTLKAKSIKDIIDAMNMHRTILNKRRSTDKVIVLGLEKPEEFEQLPEVVDGKCEVLDS